MRIFLCLLPLLFSSVAQAIGLPMRKLALGIVALICVAALPATARAADIPSSASGDYVGGGWHCRLLAYAHPVYGYPSTVTEYRCTDPQTNQRYAARTWWGCPVTQAYPEVLYPWWTLVLAPPPNVSMMVASVSPATLTLTFDGVPVVMSLAQSIQSPAPYTCAFGPTLRFRVFGR